MSRFAITLLLLSLLTCGAFADHRVHGIRGKKVKYTTANPKITKEMARQVKLRDGFAAEDKKRVVRFVIPPRLGGLGDFNNLQTFSKGEAERRKKVEKEVIKKFEKGEISLGDAQARVLHWKEYSTIQRQQKQMVRIRQ
ncbi:MAG TPA: hypothetical protein VGK99_09545 [Acidobacteriota bacterium]